MVAEGARRMDEAQAKKLLGVNHWVKDVNWNEALERLVSRPTVNIEGLVGGYTGPGGKTILPHQAIAKLDLRLVPDMNAQEALAALKAHLAKRGYRDIEVRMTGGYDPTSTPADSPLIREGILRGLQTRLTNFSRRGIRARSRRGYPPVFARRRGGRSGSWQG